MFDYPLRIETVSPKHLWVREPSGERVLLAEAGPSGERGVFVVRRCGEGRPRDEILRVVDAATGGERQLEAPRGGMQPPGERLSAEALKRWYGGPGVPGARRFHYHVWDRGRRALGHLRVESNWQGIWEIADAGGEVIGRLARKGMLFRDSNVELAGLTAMRLRRRSLLFGGMELSRAEDTEISADWEKLLLACVIVMLLSGSSGDG